MRRGPKPAKSTEAKPPVARKSPKNEDSRVRDLEQRLAEALRDKSEALEQQMATSQILRAISNSPRDVRPVFDAIAQSAARLCEAFDASIFRVDGDRLVFVAHHGPIAQRHGDFSLPLVRGTVGGRSVLESRTVQVADLQNEDREFPEAVENARRFGFRTILTVPLLREGIAIGGIQLRRTEVQLFSERQLALLETFADQAVIAIENVRLFTETKEALEQQTATSEILRVIASSPTDLQPVLDAVVENAARLCEAVDAQIFRVEEDFLRLVASTGPIPQWSVGQRIGISREWVTGRAVVDRQPVHVHDLATAPEVEFPQGRTYAKEFGHRTTLAIPLLREDASIGAILIRRTEVRPFTDTQITLLQTFADQAVISIENVRLFTELEASNRELRTALDTQTATSDILSAISRSQTDVQPVFDSIVASAVRLLAADNGALTRIVGDNFELAAFTGTGGAGDAALRAAFPWPLQAEGAHTKAVRDRTSINIADARTDLGVSETRRALARVFGYGSLAVVPLLRHGEALGTIAVTRREPGGFTDDQIALLQTFADQAVIAIENARLLSELQVRTAEVEAASQHKSEFLANMSHELRTPLNAVIGFSEVLSERMFGELNEKQEEYLKDIHASGQHLLSLINDILDLSKIEAGRMELELTDFDLPTAIENALTLVRERAGRRGIALHQIVDQQLGEVRGDERKIKQVLLNLLSNALKFTPEGGRVDVRATVSDGMVEVSVTDTGIGIAPEDQEAVFEEFRQVGTADKKVEGTGLGLTLSRKFIELHGGRIWVQSQLGAGSTFTFTIPAERNE